ncbi:hypothetical protein BH11PSE12_BH11PSE12_14860 [soil metagenome]
MFDFLSKLLFRRPKAGKPVGKAAVVTASDIVTLQLAEDKKRQVEQARASTLAQIEQLVHDEPALIALLMACDFADGRFKAAQSVHSKAGLEQVRAAMRNNDKRVAKLMQSRLDLIAKAGQQEQLALQCIGQAGALLGQAHLLSNQVGDLDTQYAALSSIPDALRVQFVELRQAIETKLQTQTGLQRRMLDLLGRLNQCSQEQAGEAVADTVEEATFPERLSAWQQELDACMAQPEAASLPKNVLAECSKKIQQQRQRWELSQIELQQQQKLQQRMKPVEPAKLSGSVTSDMAALDDLADGADGVDSTDGADDVVLENAQAVVSEPLVTPVELVRTEKNTSTLNAGQIIAAIQAMEEALEQGSVQTARKYERQLRGVDVKTAGLTTQQKERLFQARSELGYLQGWAKWGGDVSRDELIKAVDELPALSLAPNELAKKIAALRERWKEMEATSGAASKELWSRFDAACNTAYAPAALYFQEQAEQRKLNLAAAEAVVVALRESAAELLQGQPAWKAIAQFCMQAQQNWKKLGHVDRKYKTRLDAEFEMTLQLLLQPLQQRRQEDILAREALIAEVAGLDPLQRNVTDQLRVLQERWQAHATAVPLRRKDEQALWEKYRAACDSLFAQRKLASGEADSQRKENLAIKLDLCAVLEQAASASEINVQQLLLQTASTWKKIGAVPRAEDLAIEQRYEAAISVLKKQGQTLLDEQQQVTKLRCLKTLSLCQSLEKMLANETTANDSAAQIARLSSEWKQIDVLPASLNATLQMRFQAAIAALGNNDQAYRALLQNNLTDFDAALLHLEILSSIDSPAELARERLQMQVEVLQNSLKRGATEDAAHELLKRLLAMPVLLDGGRLLRLEKVLLVSAAL